MKTILLAMAFALCWSTTAEEKTAPSAEQISTWVKQLGSDDFAARLQAENNLRDAGDAAKTEIEKNTQSSDAEIAMRAKRLLAMLKTTPLLKKMIAAVIEVESVSADMEMSMTMMGKQVEMKGSFISSGDGTKINMKMDMTAAGQAMKAHAVSDGETMWSEIEVGEHKLVQKYKMETMAKLGGQQNPLKSIEQLQEQFAFTEVKEEMHDGKAFFVLEGTLRQEAIEKSLKNAEEIAGPVAAKVAKDQFDKMHKSRIFVNKNDYQFARSEVLDHQGNVIMSVKLDNIKLNVPVDQNTFAYTPPEDVEVMDMEKAFEQARQIKH
jgi:outer membrane lipoprotein-sorting protein